MYVCDLTKLGVIHKTSVQRERGGYVQSGHGGGDIYAVVDVHKLYHYNNLCDSLLLLDIVIPRLTISLKKKNGTIFSRVLAVLTINTEILVSDDGHTVLKCDHIKWMSKRGGESLAEVDIGGHRGEG